uniref:Corticotropin-releasing factor domain-containing protein n=1 Tax=Electrophorus electricus TaxID=8005 RepID=A0A4W4HP11_ELEEL
MRGMGLCLYLLLLFPSTFLCQLTENKEDSMTVNVLSRMGVFSSLLPPEYSHDLRQKRVSRPASSTPKRAPQGTRFALSLDVPTSILSILIDLAKNHDMRAKAAANAELMARIGKRK